MGRVRISPIVSGPWYTVLIGALYRRAYWCCITAMLEARDKHGRCYERKFNDVYVDRREDGEVAAQRKPLPA